MLIWAVTSTKKWQRQHRRARVGGGDDQRARKQPTWTSYYVITASLKSASAADSLAINIIVDGLPVVVIVSAETLFLFIDPCDERRRGQSTFMMVSIQP